MINELACLLKSPEVPTASVKAGHVSQVKELRAGIEKYENLLQSEMEVAKVNADILEKQAVALLMKTEEVKAEDKTQTTVVI